MRMLGESKILSFLFPVPIKEMRRGDESKISFCNPMGGKLLFRPSASIMVFLMFRGGGGGGGWVFVDDKTSVGWFLLDWGLMLLRVWK